MNQQKALLDLKENTELLEENIRIYKEGKISAYRTVATILCALLVNKEALMVRLFPKVRFHPTKSTGMFDLLESMGLTESLQFMSVGQMDFREGGLKNLTIFDITGDLMNLDSWLNQTVLYIGTAISIKGLLKSVRDKEASHLDPDYNETLEKSRLVSYGKNESHREVVIALGEYILWTLKSLYNYKSLPDK